MSFYGQMGCLRDKREIPHELELGAVLTVKPHRDKVVVCCSEYSPPPTPLTTPLRLICLAMGAEGLVSVHFRKWPVQEMNELQFDSLIEKNPHEMRWN